MSSHRYHYLYVPIMQFLSGLSPLSQGLLAVAKAALIVALLSFQIQGIGSSSIEKPILEAQAVTVFR